MKDRFLGKGALPIAALLAAVCMPLPVQAQEISKASPYRMRANGRQVTPVSASLSSGVAIVASDWIEARKSADVTGDVIVNDNVPGPYPSGFSLSVEGATVSGTVKGDSVNLAKSSTVANVCTNALTNGGATITGLTGSYGLNGAAPCDDDGLPIFSPLPPFHSSNPGTAAVSVPSNGTLTIGPNRYGDITVGKNATLFVTGGVVEAQSVFLDSNAELRFQAASELRVAGRFNASKGNAVGPAAGSGLTAVDIVIYVEGFNASGAAFDSAGVVGEGNTATANFYVANGTFDLGKGSSLAGSVIAKSVIIETNSSLSANNAFTNQAPTAESQSVVTNGAASLEIILKGSDPEGEDLTFAIVSPPTPSIGNITSGPTPIVPMTPPDRCSVSATICAVDGDCPMGETCEDGGEAGPITMASVTYTPVNPGADELNSFTFQVMDPPGATAVAVVTIDDVNDTSPPPPAATAVSAVDVVAETTSDTPVTIGLSAGACEGSVLEYTITSLPSSGSLSDGGADIESVPHTLAGNMVVFTPASGFEGDVSFDYSATDIGTVGACATTVDTATVTVNVSAEADLAPEQTIETTQNQPIEFILGNLDDPPAAPLKMARVAAGLPVANAPLPGATIAGNVKSTDGTTGDAKDNLPGPAPIFISAAVDVTSAGATLTWTVAATFADGGTANGTFDYNASTESVSNWNISVSGGGVGTFPALTYTPANSSGSVVCLFAPCPSEQEKSVKFDLNSSTRQLRITPLNPLTDAGGSVNIDLNTGPPGNPSASIECFNCAPSRLINGGTFSATPVTSIHRIQMEWDVTDLPDDPSLIQACEITVITNKGTVDSLDTTFFAGAAEQNGTLDLTDFQAPVGITPLAVMPASIGVSNTDVPFSFDVTAAVQSARSADFNFFSVQGRVDEGLAGGGFERGLQIRSTATGNLSNQKEPQLVCTTGGITGPQLSWTVVDLPAGGTLFGPGGTPVVAGQTFSFQPTLTFVSPTAGTFNFNYSVTLGAVVDNATVTLVVNAGDTCVIDGRRAQCSQSQCSDGLDNDGDFVPAVLDTDGQVVVPAKGGIDWDGVLGQFPPDPACSGPADDDEFPVNP